MNCESGVLSVIATPFVAHLLDRDDVRPLAIQADDVHALVLLAGREAVDDIGGGQRLAVRPLDVRLDLQRQHLVAVAPLPALGQPGVDLASTGDGRDDERLVHGALHEAAVQHRARIRVEAARERGITRARHDETRVRPGCRLGLLCRPCRCTRCQDRGDHRDRTDDACGHQTGARGASWTPHSPTPFGSSQHRRLRWIHRFRAGTRDPAVGRFSFHGTPTSPTPVTFTRSFQCGQGLFPVLWPRL